MELEQFLQFYLDNISKYYSSGDVFFMSEDDVYYVIKSCIPHHICRLYDLLQSLGFCSNLNIDYPGCILRVHKV